MAIVKPHLVSDIGDRPVEAFAHELEQVLQQIGEAVIVKDLNAVVTYWNGEAASLYGFSAAQAIGQPLRNLHAADLSDADYGRLLERVRSGKPSSSITDRRKIRRRDCPCQPQDDPAVDAAGKLVGEITVARDVTVLHRTEESLRAPQGSLRVRLAAIRDANRKLNQEMAARTKADRARQRTTRSYPPRYGNLRRSTTTARSWSHMAELLPAVFAVSTRTVRREIATDNTWLAGPSMLVAMVVAYTATAGGRRTRAPVSSADTAHKARRAAQVTIENTAAIASRPSNSKHSGAN